MDVTAPERRRGGRRRTAARVVAALSGVALLYFPGLGIVDLISAIQGLSQPQDPVSVMRVGYGLLVGFMLPMAFFTVARDPERSAAPLLQVFAAALAFAVAAVSGVVGGSGWLRLLLVLGGVVHTLVRGPGPRLRFGRERLLSRCRCGHPRLASGSTGRARLAAGADRARPLPPDLRHGPTRRRRLGPGDAPVPAPGRRSVAGDGGLRRGRSDPLAGDVRRTMQTATRRAPR